MGRQQRDLSAFMDGPGDGPPPGPGGPPLQEAGPRVMTVSELTRTIKDHLEDHPVLQDARVVGELSNVSPSAKGAQVVARGHVSVYERQGKYQLYGEELVRKGVGDLYQRFLVPLSKLER